MGNLLWRFPKVKVFFDSLNLLFMMCCDWLSCRLITLGLIDGSFSLRITSLLAPFSVFGQREQLPSSRQICCVIKLSKCFFKHLKETLGFQTSLLPNSVCRFMAVFILSIHVHYQRNRKCQSERRSTSSSANESSIYKINKLPAAH